MQRSSSHQGGDRSTYNRQRDRLRQELALLKMQEHDAKLAGLDVDGVLGRDGECDYTHGNVAVSVPGQQSPVASSGKRSGRRG